MNLVQHLSAHGMFDLDYTAKCLINIASLLNYWPSQLGQLPLVPEPPSLLNPGYPCIQNQQLHVAAYHVQWMNITSFSYIDSGLTQDWNWMHGRPTFERFVQGCVTNAINSSPPPPSVPGSSDITIAPRQEWKGSAVPVSSRSMRQAS